MRSGCQHGHAEPCSLTSCIPLSCLRVGAAVFNAHALGELTAERLADAGFVKGDGMTYLLVEKADDPIKVLSRTDRLSSPTAGSRSSPDSQIMLEPADVFWRPIL